MRTATRERMRITIEQNEPALHYYTKYIHVGVEFPSSHANICEITHAHYYGKIYTYILLKTETQVAYLWEWNFCPLMRTFTTVRMRTMMERYLRVFY